MKICLYIPCRNGESTLPEVFDAVSRQTRSPDLLLLVDDRSTDATPALARSAGWTVIATTSERSGLSAARNRATAAAVAEGCDVIAGLDADAVPGPTYVETLTHFYETHPDVAGTCGNMRERFTATPSDLWRAVYLRQHWGDKPIENPPILFGSSAAHRTEVLLRLGGFNEALGTNFEDTELTQRLLRAGHRLAYMPELASEHLKRDTPDSVLAMFWNWYRPGAELAGQFGDVQAWLNHRHPWIWQDFTTRVVAGAPFPSLAAITTALPWTQLMRDLQLLGSRSETPVDLRPVLRLAAEVHACHGYNHEFIHWLCRRLEAVLAGRQGGAPLHPLVHAGIQECAKRALPRKQYWNDLAASIEAVTLACDS